MTTETKTQEQWPKASLATRETLLHALAYNAKHHPKFIFVQWVNNSCNVVNTMSYEELWQESATVAQLLAENGVQRGDRVMIAYPFGLDFLPGLFGCMRAGAIACSVYPPNFIDKAIAKHSFAQFNNQVADAGATVALTTSKYKVGVWASGQKTPLKWLATDTKRAYTFRKRREQQLLTLEEVTPETVAFIQYSSGSTGEPKGIVIPQRAVVHNIQTILSDLSHDGFVPAVTWMPQYHDYSLIGGFLTSIVRADTLLTACSPLDFIRRPLLWADMIEKFSAILTGGPNFSYGLLAKRMKAANRKLTSNTLIRATIAAEPIAPRTIQDMEDIGIPRAAINPGYGLAEVCARATSVVGDEIRVLDGVVCSGLLQARSTKFDMHIRIASPDSKTSVDEANAVDQDGDYHRILEEGEVGEIFLRGPDLASRYWNKPELDSRFRCRLSDGEEYFATGDLGRVVDDRLYVVGRLKEVIIINGRNVYPTDIERVIENEYPDIVRPGSTVAFQNSDKDVGIVIEIRKFIKSLKEVPTSFSVDSIRSLVSNAIQADVGQLVILKQGSVPKTTSGKLKRVETRQRSLEDRWNKDSILRTWSSSCLSELGKKPCGVSSLNPTDGSNLESVEGIGEMDVPERFSYILRKMLGGDVNLSSPWAENGLGSLKAAELAQMLEEHCHVTLPPNFTQVYPTPQDLRDFVWSSQGKSFPVYLSDIPSDDKELKKPLLSMLQIIGSASILCLFAASLITPFYVGKLLSGAGSAFSVGDWYPLVVPTFFLTFSIVVLVSKFLVVGKYRPRRFKVHSFDFLRWWYVDRLVDMWEFFVGRFFLETKFLWGFYTLLGARIDDETNINAFLREWDLLEIGRNTTIDHQLRCRRFGRCDEQDSLTFRPIRNGEGCSVSGFLGPGSEIGHRCKVMRHSAVGEGAKVPAETLVRGSPAYHSGKATSFVQHSWLFEMGKMVCLIVELYHFYALVFLSRVVLDNQLPASWRYSSLLYWVLLLLSTSVFGMLSSVCCKWLLIGRRRPGDDGPTVVRRLCFWFCDMHFRFASITLLPVLFGSRIWSLLLALHGLDIDISSEVLSPQQFVPSKVDFVRIRHSSLSQIEMEETENSSQLEVVDSSLGYVAVVHVGVKIHRCVVPPYTTVDTSMFDLNTRKYMSPNESDRPMKFSLFKLLVQECARLSLSVILFATLIPSYEFIAWSVLDGSSPVGEAVACLCLSLLIQGTVWTLFHRLLQILVFALHENLFQNFYFMYYVVAGDGPNWSLAFLLHGTVFFSWYIRFLGAKVEGNLLYFGAGTPKETHLLSFANNTIIDYDCVTNGHYKIFGHVSTSKTRIGGIVHPGCYSNAGAVVTGPETGPWKTTLMASSEDTKRHEIC